MYKSFEIQKRETPIFVLGDKTINTMHDKPQAFPHPLKFHIIGSAGGVWRTMCQCHGSERRRVLRYTVCWCHAYGARTSAYAMPTSRVRHAYAYVVMCTLFLPYRSLPHALTPCLLPTHTPSPRSLTQSLTHSPRGPLPPHFHRISTHSLLLTHCPFVCVCMRASARACVLPSLRPLPRSLTHCAPPSPPPAARLRGRNAASAAAAAQSASGRNWAALVDGAEEEEGRAYGQVLASSPIINIYIYIYIYSLYSVPP
jgi:hypothetical protein